MFTKIAVLFFGCLAVAMAQSPLASGLGNLATLPQKALSPSDSGLSNLAELPQKAQSALGSGSGSLAELPQKALSPLDSGLGDLAELPKKALPQLNSEITKLAELPQKVLSPFDFILNELADVPKKVLAAKQKAVSGVIEQLGSGFVKIHDTTKNAVGQGLDGVQEVAVEGVKNSVNLAKNANDGLAIPGKIVGDALGSQKADNKPSLQSIFPFFG